MTHFNNQLSDEVTITDEAVKQLFALVASQDGAEGIRIFVSGGGCSGMTYGMTFVEQATEFDTVWESGELKVHIDAVALSLLEGVGIDYNVDGDSSSFIFSNVFQNTSSGGSCGGCAGAT